MSTDRELLELAAKAKPGKRVWGKGDRCAECCNGDRCDDASHYSRDKCPHCLGTGWSLWTESGMAEYKTMLKRRSAAIGEQLNEGVKE